MSQRPAEPAPARPRRIGTGKLIAIAIGVAVVFMASLSAVSVLNRTSCAAGSQEKLNISASPDVAPAITTVASAFDAHKVVSGGRCVNVQVTATDPALAAAEIDGQRARQGAVPDAWIPDSSLWPDLARTYPAGASAVRPTGQSVALSPLLLVTSAAVAEQTHVFDVPPGWNVLLPPADGGPPASLRLSVDLPDPASSAAGQEALIEVSRLIGTGSAASHELTEFTLGATARPDSDSPAALGQFAQTTKAKPGITVASEQTVLAYDKTKPLVPVVARYPTGQSASLGSPELDYPYVLTTTNPAAATAARQFGSYLQTSYAQQVIRLQGFRSADGDPDAIPASADLASQPLQLASAPTAAQAATSLLNWQRLGQAYKDLDLIDVSSAMDASAGGGKTLEQMLTQTAVQGLDLFPPRTQMGLWEVGDASSAAKPYQSLMTMGALSAPWGVVTRGAQLRQVLSTLKAGDGKLALNDALLAAYKQMTKTYTPGFANVVLVLTTGVDSAPGDISGASLVTQLKHLYNPKKPVSIIPIVIGSQAGFANLQQAASATGGKAYLVTQPSQVASIFVDATSSRVCEQNC